MPFPKLSSLLRPKPETPSLRERAADLQDRLARSARPVPEIAAPAAEPILPPTAPQEDPAADAELLRLGRQFDVAVARAIALQDNLERREEAAAADMPERPAGLVFRAEDNTYGLRRQLESVETFTGSEIRATDIERMRGMTFKHQVLRDARPGERGWHDYRGKVPEMVPWPEAQARADELLAAWDAWKAEQDRVNDIHGVPAADEAVQAADNVVLDLSDRMALLPADTAEGMRIKLRASAHWEPSHNAVYPGNRLLNSLLRDTEGQVTTLAGDERPDPIFALIETSRRAEAEMKAFGERSDAASQPGWLDREDALADAQCKARYAVWDTAPTTQAGRLALVEYAYFHISLYGAELAPGTDLGVPVHEILKALKAAVAAERPEAPPAPGFGPDAHIAALAARFCEAYAANGIADRALMAGTGSDEAWRPLYDATSALMDRLDETEPQTVLGMALKCLGPLGSMAWQIGKDDDPAKFDPWERCAAEFEAALLAGRLAPITAAEPGDSKLPPDRAWAVAQAAAVDLSGLTVLQLCNLFGRFAETADRWLDTAHASWTRNETSGPFLDQNAAGRLASREQDRMAEIRTRIAREIERREPADDWERDQRLEVLIRYELMCEGSLRHAPELRAQIATKWGA